MLHLSRLLEFDRSRESWREEYKGKYFTPFNLSSPDVNVYRNGGVDPRTINPVLDRGGHVKK
jgi:hypothetical protein